LIHVIEKGSAIMMLGMSLPTFTVFHVIISLIGIGSGLIVVYGLLTAKRLKNWTALFLITTVLTSATGFLFPFHGFKPSYAVGILSLVVLAVAIVALYVGDLAGAWRWIYVVTAVIALYFNVFVLVAQSFDKVPALKALAPTQSEPPFAIAQLIVLAIFIVLGFLSVRRFRPL
jgi:hypothetical protein